MFPKLSALALWPFLLTYVSALGMSAPPVGVSGSPVTINFDITEGDPTQVNLYLFRNAWVYSVANRVTVAPTVDVQIPDTVPLGVYQFLATKVDSFSKQYAVSNQIVIS